MDAQAEPQTYKRRLVEDFSDLLALGQWLQSAANSAEAPLGFAIWPGLDLAFANRQIAWLIQDVSPEGKAADLLRNVLIQALTGSVGPALVTRNLEKAYRALRDFLRLDDADREQNLAQRFVGCLDSLGYAVGQRILPASNFPSVAEDAMDSFLTEQQLSVDGPPYYRRVALPNARNRAIGARPWRERGATRFVVSYKHLFLRVLAHFSNDPTLIRLFTEEDADIIGGLSSRLGLAPPQVIPFLTWVVLAGDSAALYRHFPEHAEALPESPHVVQRAVLDKVMPVVRRWVIDNEELCRDSCGSVSLYGRPSVYTRDVPAAMYHLVFGSVRDIVEVALASFASLVGPTGEVLLTSFDGHSAAQFTGYADAEPIVLEERLLRVARLAHPLGNALPLDPAVLMERPSTREEDVSSTS